MELATKPFHRLRSSTDRPRPYGVPSNKRASLSDAKLAYFGGDFERCLAICADIGIQPTATASEVALLSARACLRSGQPHEAEAVVINTVNLHVSVDASATAQMLLGTARVEQDNLDDGIAILVSAAADAGRAHFAIRSEIAFSTALGYWAKRDIDAVEHYLSRVDQNADIIHARALQLGAWCQFARGNYRRCAELFIATLLCLDTCRAHDRAINAAAISMLSILAAELFDSEFARVAKERARAMEWTPGLVMPQFLTLLHEALFAELAGDTVEAYGSVIQARNIAPTVACEAAAWSICSAIARNADEACGAVAYAQWARHLLATQNASDLEGEERLSLLAVAESCAHFDSTAADQLLSTYRGLAPADRMHASSDDPCLVAEESFVAGVVAEALGDVHEAQRCYLRAFKHSEHIGYVRRALIAALALVKLTDDEAMRNYLVKQLHGTSNYITRYLARRRADGLSALEQHPIVGTLSQAQREVVVLVCQGKSNKEIAVLRHVGEQTIKNMLTKDVFRAFNVSSRAALVGTCLRGTD